MILRKVAIVTDGSCDLPKELIEKYQIFVVPFQVVIGTKAYQMYGDYGTITKDEFYEKIKNSKEPPTTSVPAPKSFYDIFQEAIKEAESVIGIFLSKNLSSTFQNATLVLTMIDDYDISLIDSQAAASTLGAIVIEAAKMAQNNATKEEILQRVEFLIPRARLAGIMDNVEATYRSGRIGWGRKFLVSKLRIRPIVNFKDGYIVSGGKIRGRRDEILKRMKFMAPFVVKHAITDTIFIWHVRCPEDAQYLKDIMEESNYDNKQLIVQEAGPVIGTHVGEGALAYMYIGKYQKRWLKTKRK